MKTKVVLGAITLEGEQRSARIARKYATEQLKAEQIPPDDAVLIVSELVTNALQHGPDGRIDMILECDDEVVRIKVIDGGGQDETPQAHAEVPSDNECGRGLLIVDQLARSWGARCAEQGTTVWADVLRA